MDVGGWLRSLGLEQYETAFRENKIDDTVLPSLTVEDLKDLGVGFVGHRRKLLDAIAALRAQASAPTPSLSDAPLAIDKAAKDTAERRQVTVMFSDLVGSTALSARMDPEDLREVISAYQKCVAEAVRRCGGFVAKYMGDGVLVYFGYPQAHEDDAERAVRAGLQLIAAVAALKSPVAPCKPASESPLGLVVVGDLIGSGEAQEHGVVGETPEPRGAPARDRRAEHGRHRRGHAQAARQSVRASGPWATGPQGHRRADRGPGRRYGRASVESRFEALHAGGLTALVGREEELELLLRRWSEGKDGRRPGGAALGRGRDRQVAADGGVAGTPCHRAARAAALFLLASAHGQRALSDHRPDGTRRRARARRHSRSEARQARCACSPRPQLRREDAALLAEMLSLPNDGRYPALDLAPQQRRQKNVGSADFADGGPDTPKSSADDL